MQSMKNREKFTSKRKVGGGMEGKSTQRWQSRLEQQ